MKKIVYSPDYKEKLIDLHRNLDFQFGEDVRKRVMKALDARIKMLGPMRIWEFQFVPIMVWIVIISAFTLRRTIYSIRLMKIAYTL